MGLTGLQGFAFYFCAVFGLWVIIQLQEYISMKSYLQITDSFSYQCLLLIKAGPSWEKYFVNRLHLLTNGFFGGLFVSFIVISTKVRPDNTVYIRLVP